MLTPDMTFTKLNTQLHSPTRISNSSLVRQLPCSTPFAPMRLLLPSLHSSSSSTIACPYLVSSSLSSNYSSHAPSSRRVGFSVWWDVEQCNLPTGVNRWQVRDSIEDALKANGIGRYPKEYNVFGDIFSDSEDVPDHFIHVSSERKNSVQRSLIFNLLHWVRDNPPPFHLFLISGDRDLAYVLPHLRLKNYNILLATIDSAPDVLYSAASVMWCWNSLARNKNLIGTHLNYPPSDSYGLVNCEDRFPKFIHPRSLNTEELPGCTTTDSEVHSSQLGAETEITDVDVKV